MKKMMIFGLAALILGFLSTACVDPIAQNVVDNLEKEKVTENTMIFTASLEQGDADTKTALNNALNVVWSPKDSIRIYSSTHLEGVVFKLTSGAGTTIGTFEGGDVGAAPYFAVYPASASGLATISGNIATLDLNVPQTQGFVNGSFGNEANISWAYATTTNDLFFHNLFGAVSFTLKGTQTITGANLYTRGSDILNGTAKFSLDLTNPADLNVAYTKGTNSECLSLDCGAGVTLNDSEGVTFIFCVPAGAFADGFFVEILDANYGMIRSAKGSSANIIERGVVRRMGTAINFVQQYDKDYLKDADDFAAYSGVNTSTATKSCTYIEGQSQYAYINTDGDPGSRYVRFQDWTVGYSLSFQIPTKIITLNATPSVTTKAQGNTGTAPNKITSTTDATMKVIKKTPKRAWLYDDASKNGYIIKLED